MKKKIYGWKNFIFYYFKSGEQEIPFVIYLDSMCAANLVMSEEQQEKWKGMFGRLRNCRKNTKRWVLLFLDIFITGESEQVAENV